MNGTYSIGAWHLIIVCDPRIPHQRKVVEPVQKPDNNSTAKPTFVKNPWKGHEKLAIFIFVEMNIVFVKFVV